MRQFKIINLIQLGIVLLFTISCIDKENCHDNIYIKNNSDKAIYFDKSYVYPDTTLRDDGLIQDPTNYKVEKYSENRSVTRGCYEGIMQSSYPIIMFFIYDAETLETTPWDTVAKNHLVLKRYDLSLADLERLNWTITYP